MTGNEIIIIAFIIMLVLLFAKVPVFIAVFAGSMMYFFLNPDVNLAIFAQKAIGGVESIPRFILLDKEGHIVQADMLRPSSEGVGAYLEKLKNL